MKKRYAFIVSIILMLLIYTGCSRDIAGDYAEINFDIKYAGNVSKQVVINDVNIIIRQAGDVVRELKLTIEGGTARGSTTLEYGTYDFRLEMLSGGILYYFGESNGKVIDKNTTEVGIEYTDAPVIQINPMTEMDFGDEMVNIYGDEMSFSIHAENLTEPLIVTPPPGFEVYLTSHAWPGNSDPLSIDHINGEVSLTVFVNVRPVEVRIYQGQIVCSSVNATPVNFSVRCNSVNAPMISCEPDSLDFGAVVLGTESNVMSFGLLGSDLKSEIVVRCPFKYQISKSGGSGFVSDSLVFIPVSGSVETVVFVKLAFADVLGSRPGEILCTTESGQSRIVNLISNVVPVPDFVSVDTGTFMMGSSTDAPIDNDPVHSVTLSSFRIWKKEVTQSEWVSVMGSNPSIHTGDGNLPVDNISWYEALVYCNKRSITEGFNPCYTIKSSTDPDVWGAVPAEYDAYWNSVTCNWNADGYRLPTEAEWEFAARGGNISEGYEYSGSNVINDVSWNMNNSTDTNPVGLKAQNELGLFDMTGNVVEWCWDRYEASYYQYCVDNTVTTDPRGPADGDPVLRGGSFNAMIEECTNFVRRGMMPYIKEQSQGLRVVRRN